MSIKILTDSSCDMSLDYAAEIGVSIIPLHTRFEDEEYLDNVNLSHREFFEKLIETDVFPQTSQISPYEYDEFFKENVKDGEEAIYISISSKLSGCCQSAALTASDYDNIYVVDSENACIGQRILVERAVELAKTCTSAKELAEILDEEKKKVRLIALLGTLEYLKKGGRISAAAAMAGSLLNIKPVITIRDGEVAVLGKARGSKNGNNKLNEFINLYGGIDFSKPTCLAYSGLDDSLLQKYIDDNMDIHNKDHVPMPISTIGCAIGTHAGPGAIAIAFFA